VTACLVLAGCGARESPLPLPVPGSTTAGPVAVAGQAIELVPDGAIAAQRIVAAIEGARRTIDVEIYEFDRADIRDSLLAARRRGVALRLIADPTVSVNATTLAALRDAGALVELFPDLRNQIDHVKLLVVDGRTAIFGGMNWGRGSYRNHDFDVVMVGPAVAHLEAIFVADLARCGHVSEHPPLVEADPAGLRLLTTYPEPEIRPAVLAAIGEAKQFIFVEMYVLTDAGAISALGAASRRGVPTWVLLDANQDLNQAAAARLREAGVRARFYRTSGEKLHAKAMVVDGATLVVGSANWTSSGFTRNHELDAIIRSPALAAPALARMEADWRASD
jgi:cardiolipin synthase